MKFKDLPIEIQHIFIDAYNKKAEAQSTMDALKLRQGELEKELSELQAKCTSSHWYAKTRERREALQEEITDICWKNVALCNQKINAEAQVFKAVERLYNETA